MSKLSPIADAYQKLLARGRLQPNAGQQALVHELGLLQRKLIEHGSSRLRFRKAANINGVYIYGGVGTGKSRIADLFASTLPKNITSQRIHFHEFMVNVHQRLHAARSRSDYAGDPLLGIGKQIHAEHSVMCFDEFQVSGKSSRKHVWVPLASGLGIPRQTVSGLRADSQADIVDAMVLKRLFGSFWSVGGVMVSTSNRHPTELYKMGLNRAQFVPFIKELQERCLIWEMKGNQDYRTSGRPIVLVPVFFTNREAFERAISEATTGAPFTDVTLNVAMSRKMLVRAASLSSTHGRSRNVVLSSFSSLCEARLGTSDYHALCNFADTVFLDGVRQFGADQLDFARRFITLIDIAYESKTKVVCMSSVPITELFTLIGVNVDENPGTIKTGDLKVKGEGGSSSSMMSTFIDNVEWSATGLMTASLASGGAGETDVRFAVGRALSRLAEMGTRQYEERD